MQSSSDAARQILPAGYSADLIAAFAVVIMVSAALFTLVFRRMRAAPMTSASADDLFLTAAKSGPVLIGVGLPRWSPCPIDPRYQSEWGWTPGLRHAVVFFGALPNGKIDIGDPSTGREKWDRQALSVLWDGEGLYLTSR